MSAPRCLPRALPAHETRSAWSAASQGPHPRCLGMRAEKSEQRNKDLVRLHTILSRSLDPLLLRTCSPPMSRSVGYSFCAYALGCRRTHSRSFAGCWGQGRG